MLVGCQNRPVQTILVLWAYVSMQSFVILRELATEESLISLT